MVGILASFQAVLTMSGIAGIVLSLGMAVDANVLIFERTKEELAYLALAKEVDFGVYKHLAGDACGEGKVVEYLSSTPTSHRLSQA